MGTCAYMRVHVCHAYVFVLRSPTGGVLKRKMHSLLNLEGTLLQHSVLPGPGELATAEPLEGAGRLHPGHPPGGHLPLQSELDGTPILDLDHSDNSVPLHLGVSRDEALPVTVGREGVCA